MSDDLVKRLTIRLQEIYDRPHDFSNGQKSEAAGLARDRIEELEVKLAKAVEGERERCAKIADKCQRENGPLSKKNFNEQYRRGLEAAGQAIAAAIRAELTGEKP